MNTDADTYTVGETAHISLGVLDDAGMPICNADTQLTLIRPDGTSELLAVSVTPECHIMDSTNRVADYIASTGFSMVGRYTLRLSADNGSGVKVFEKTINVTEGAGFRITRDIATRLYPFGTSPASITVTFGEDFSGSIIERVPADFDISETDAVVTIQGDSKLLTWNVSASAGETKIFNYTYDAPDISPMYYTLGAMQFISNDTVVYEEQQAWGIANDAPSDDFVTTWKTDNAGISNSTSITIPTTGTGYNYDVDWNNDGTFDEFGITGSATHDFGVAGTYTIRIQ